METASQSTDDLALAGLRVMIVEDTLLIAMDLENQLTRWGCDVVGPFSKVEPSLHAIAGQIDGALLDVNLSGEQSFPIAAALAERNIPFIFLTGYDHEAIFPEALAAAPRLSKPINYAGLRQEMLLHFRLPQT